MNIDNKLIEKFKEISQRIILVKRKVASKFNISVNYYKTFAVLLTKDNITQTTLSDIYCIDKPATSRIVSKMENEGFIHKEYHDGNKKNTYISLTEKGRALACDIVKSAQEECSKYFKCLTGEDKNVLLTLLDKSLKGGANA